MAMEKTFAAREAEDRLYAAWEAAAVLRQVLMRQGPRPIA